MPTHVTLVLGNSRRLSARHDSCRLAWGSLQMTRGHSSSQIMLTLAVKLHTRLAGCTPGGTYPVVQAGQLDDLAG